MHLKYVDGEAKGGDEHKKSVSNSVFFTWCVLCNITKSKATPQTSVNMEKRDGKQWEES